MSVLTPMSVTHLHCGRAVGAALAAPERRPSSSCSPALPAVQQQLQAASRCRLAGGSAQHLAVGGRLASAVQAAAAGSRAASRRSPAR